MEDDEEEHDASLDTQGWGRLRDQFLQVSSVVGLPRSAFEERASNARPSAFGLKQQHTRHISTSSDLHVDIEPSVSLRQRDAFISESPPSHPTTSPLGRNTSDARQSDLDHGTLHHDSNERDAFDGPRVLAVTSPSHCTRSEPNLQRPLRQELQKRQKGQNSHSLRPGSPSAAKPSKMSASQPEPQHYSRSDFGDTQVLPTQVYDNYNYAESRKDALESRRDIAEGLDSSDSSVDENYASGHMGHVDLMQDLEDGEPNRDEDSADELGAGKTGVDEAEDVQAETVTSPSRFSPVTPAVAGNKHDRKGNLVSSIARTPAPDLAGMFQGAAGKPAMHLTQVFDQTQAPSSPFEHGDKSDPVFERPSPVFQVPSNSSPVANVSSPVPSKKRDFHRATTDPRDRYVSMKDSQQRRERTEHDRLQAVLASISPVGSENEDELFDETAEEKARQRQKKVAKRIEAVKYSDPVRRSTRDTSKRSEHALVTPSTTGKTTTPFTRQNYVVISDDTPIAPLGDADAQESSQDEPLDEYDELSQSVIPSDGPSQPPSKAVETVSNMQTLRKKGHSMSSPIRGRYADITRHERERTDELQHQENLTVNEDSRTSGQSQVVVIQDSQPLRDSLPPRPLDPSSITSQGFVTQTQREISLSSGTKARVANNTFEVSSIPHPPPYSSLTNDGTGSGKDRQSANSSPDNLESSPPIRSRRHRGGQNNDLAEVDRQDRGSVEVVPQTESKKNSSSEESKYYTPAGPPVKQKPETIPETSPMYKFQTVGQDGIQDLNEVPAERVGDGPAKEKSNGRNASSRNESKEELRFDTAKTQPSGSPTKESPKRSQRNSAPHSAKKSKMRKLTEIAADATPPDAHEHMSLDFNIMDDDDMEYDQVVTGKRANESPQNGRTRLQRRRVLQEPAKEINSLPLQSPMRSREEQRAEDMIENFEGDPQQLKLLSQTSPSKRTKDGKVPPNSSKRKSRRSGRANITADDETDADPLASDASEDVEDGKESARQNQVSANDRTEPDQAFAEEEEEDPLAAENPPAATEQSPRVLNRVLACYKTDLKYYPATCIGSGISSSTAYRVRYDDGTTDEVEGHVMVKLSLRVGDQVKVDIHGRRKSAYLVRGFKDRHVDNNTDFPQTDADGFRTLILVPAQRQSLPVDEAWDRAQEIEAPVSNIYLTKELKRQFRGREFTGLEVENTDGSKAATPSYPPSVVTTPSKKRRHTGVAHAQPAKTSVAIPAIDLKSDLFTNMVFAITYPLERDEEKGRITKLIVENGGRLLSDGFDELFDIPTAADPAPAKASDGVAGPNTSTVKLTATAENLGFTSLITDTHSRKEKYVQALALNIPCLSGRWITDCVTRGSLVPWAPYLLAAGESSFLHGVVHSRTLSGPASTFPAAPTLGLSTIVSHRANLLAGRSVILVVGKGEDQQQRHRVIVFITYALGARRVEQVPDVASAKSLLDADGDSWHWVYVDGAKFEKTKQTLFVRSRGKAKAGKKRKAGARGQAAATAEANAMVKLVDKEFVVQSLILGALLESW